MQKSLARHWQIKPGSIFKRLYTVIQDQVELTPGYKVVQYKEVTRAHNRTERTRSTSCWMTEGSPKRRELPGLPLAERVGKTHGHHDGQGRSMRQTPTLAWQKRSWNWVEGNFLNMRGQSRESQHHTPRWRTKLFPPRWIPAPTATKNKRHSARNGRTKTVSICTWYDPVYRKSHRIHKNTTELINSGHLQGTRSAFKSLCSQAPAVSRLKRTLRKHLHLK